MEFLPTFKRKESEWDLRVTDIVVSDMIAAQTLNTIPHKHSIIENRKNNVKYAH